MDIKSLVKENEKIVINGHCYEQGSLNVYGDIIVTDKRILTQYNKSIYIISFSEVSQIEYHYSDYSEKYVIFVRTTGDSSVEICFASNTEWREWSEKVFTAINKYMK